jgi:hypothetical protein
MTKLGRRTLILLAIVAAGLLAACDPTGKLLYRGDGTFSDRTEFNRPRFVIRFNKIPIFQTGANQFHFRGLPHEKMTLVLYVDDSSSQKERDLKRLQTAIEAVLIDSHGNDFCKSSKQPSLNSQDSVWVLSGGPGGEHPLFWHWQCHNFQAHPGESYELTIRITRADPRGEKIFVTPTLEGGGIEFP